MKILHSADWHLDSAFQGQSPEAAAALRRALLHLPQQLADLCKLENCDLMLLSGDLFDGPYTAESLHALKVALQEVKVPVFIAPGNHDFCSPDSPWLAETWPENVHIFTHPQLESVVIPSLDCRIYGAGFNSMDCKALLGDFIAEGKERYHIAVLHGDPTQRKSPYNPITQSQVEVSKLDYLALGHVHKTGSFRTDSTLCAWPGCPMGRGFDELEEKGVLLVTLEETAEARFVPLDTPRFYDLEAPVFTDPQAAVAAVLPAVANEDHYRVTVTGEWDDLDQDDLRAQFAQFPNLQLRDHTVPVPDIWGTVREDSLEGEFFRRLHQAMEDAADADRETVELAAKISRRILDGREVVLP